MGAKAPLAGNRQGVADQGVCRASQGFDCFDCFQHFACLVQSLSCAVLSCPVQSGPAVSNPPVFVLSGDCQSLSLSCLSGSSKPSIYVLETCERSFSFHL